MTSGDVTATSFADPTGLGDNGRDPYPLKSLYRSRVACLIATETYLTYSYHPAALKCARTSLAVAEGFSHPQHMMIRRCMHFNITLKLHGVVLRKGVAFLAEIPQNYRFDGFPRCRVQTRCAPTMVGRAAGEKGYLRSLERHFA